MEHLLVKVVDFELLDAYVVRVCFDDGREQVIDFEPVLYGHYYAPLRDKALFRQLFIDEDAHTLAWRNGADFDPATLYRWHEGDGAELARRAEVWEKEVVTGD